MFLISAGRSPCPLRQPQAVLSPSSPFLPARVFPNAPRKIALCVALGSARQGALRGLALHVARCSALSENSHCFTLRVGCRPGSFIFPSAVSAALGLSPPGRAPLGRSKRILWPSDIPQGTRGTTAGRIVPGRPLRPATPGTCRSGPGSDRVDGNGSVRKVGRDPVKAQERGRDSRGHMGHHRAGVGDGPGGAGHRLGP